MSLWKRLVGVAIAEDEALNAAVLDGDAHITTSAQCGSQIVAHRACWFCRAICWVLDRFWSGHCMRAWAAEREAYRSTRNLPGG